MPEERITLNFRERGRIVWNREVVYQDYNLFENKALIIAGNESNWLVGLEGLYFTPDFYIQIVEKNLSNIKLYIKYGTDAPMKWNCSGYPLYRCYQSLNGTYATEAECQAACKVPPGPCQPPYGQRYCVDSQTIAVWNQVKCQYDIAKCSTGVCKGGICAPPPPPPGAECTEAAARTTPCPEDPTKEKLEGCIGGKWTVIEDPCGGGTAADISTETLIVIAVIAIVTLFIILRARGKI